MHKIKNIAVALIPAILAFLLIILDPFYSIDNMICDKLYSQMDGFDNKIKIIGIDEETLAEYGPLSTWSREKTAQLVEYLYEDDNCKPEVLAIDMMFVGENDKDTDDRLVWAIRKAEHVVVASHLVYRGKTSYTSGGVAYYDADYIETEELPYDALKQEVSYGFANPAVSKDGFVRVARTSIDVDGEKRYSFATQIYNEYKQIHGEECVESLPENEQVQFFYSGKPGECAHFSMKDVLSGEISKEVFRDSIVFVGAYATGLQDSYHSSVQRGQDMYGVEVNANITNALMKGKTANAVNPWITAVLAAIILFVYTFAARAMKMYPAIIVGIWMLLGEGIIARVLAVNGYIISVFYFALVLAIICAGIIIDKYVFEAAQRRKTINSFKKYMAPQVIDDLAKSKDFHVELGGERRNVAVLFVDIRGFTSISEILSPEQMVQILNRYLTLTTSCIFNHGGMLDKFIGDATMAIFNAPNDQEDYVYEAVMAGLEMQRRGQELGEELQKEYGRTVSFGVGVHVGDAVVGNIGCNTRMDYTAIGDTVNTASRIEGQSLEGEVLISEAVYSLLEGRVEAEFKESMILKGKKEPVNVYRVINSK